MKITVTDDFPACAAIRRRVFIEEQNVPEELELDELDATAVHLLAVQDGRPVGTARLLIEGESAKIGRVAVLPEMRGTRAGAAQAHALLRAVPLP